MSTRRFRIRRFIPARAGNTRPGSSPRSGNTTRFACDARPYRFIPARAGNTHTSSRANPRAWIYELVNLKVDGSSPRVRGTRIRADRTMRVRIRPVHPRACGEHGSFASCPGAIGGRFIPARAGNTPPPPGQGGPSSYPVHPRACGEHAGLGQTIRRTNGSGSSPRVRGTPRHPSPVIRHSDPVHPRACGEHMRAYRRMSLADLNGSSPRVRGHTIFAMLKNARAPVSG